MVETSEIRILFVDDEVNILKTLNRLMSLEDFNCDFANSGKEGLELLNEKRHDIIVSDMRMPEMGGDEFLTLAKDIVPHSRRFILSGYADFDSMMNALNNGGVHQFISKPWDDDQLVGLIQEAVDFVKVRKERDALVALTNRQAQELKEINKDLERRVEARTQELKQTADMLDLSYQEMKDSYGAFIDVIAQVLQRRSIAPKDHINDIAETAKALSAELQHSEDEQDAVYKAAKLHELGKVEIPESVLKKPLSQLHGKELIEYKRYPMQGYSLMTSLDNLSNVSNYVKAHCERFDGKGFPSKLAGKDIPMGARIVAIAMSYFLYRNGMVDGQSHDDEDCLKFLKASAGKAIDPNLVEPFIKVVTEQLDRKGKHEGRIALNQAQDGMILSRDLFNGRGMIMLTKGAVLTSRIIEKLKYISEKDGMDYVLYIEDTGEKENQVL
jgi:response regulator RpfG family c-di-GMP phosphodiesterase